MAHNDRVFAKRTHDGIFEPTLDAFHVIIMVTTKHHHFASQLELNVADHTHLVSLFFGVFIM